LVKSSGFYDPDKFDEQNLSKTTLDYVERSKLEPEKDVLRLNRLLLEDSYHREFKKTPRELIPSIFEDITPDDFNKDDIVSKLSDKKYLCNFLLRTNFIPILDINNIIDILFKNISSEDIPKIEKDTTYKTYFEGIGPIPSDPEFEAFSERLKRVNGFSYIKLPANVQPPMLSVPATEIDKMYKATIFKQRVNYIT
jgi:hypothetical protein